MFNMSKRRQVIIFTCSLFQVLEAEVSVPKVRVKREIPGKPSHGNRAKRSERLDSLANTFNDPMFARQWHLVRYFRIVRV